MMRLFFWIFCCGTIWGKNCLVLNLVFGVVGIFCVVGVFGFFVCCGVLVIGDW